MSQNCEKPVIFYSWQYDLRWAAHKLRGVMLAADASPSGVWELGRRSGSWQFSVGFCRAFMCGL